MSQIATQPAEEDIVTIARVQFVRLKKAGALPRHIQSVEVMEAIIAYGRVYTLEPLIAIQECFSINGKIGMSAKMIMALAMKSACTDYIMPVEITDKYAIYEAKHKQAPRGFVLKYTLEQAQQAGLTNNPMWKKDPAAMLAARCVARIVRAALPDSIVGTAYEVDELRAFEGPRLEVVKAHPALSPATITDDPLANAPKPPVSDVEVVRPWQKAGETGSWSAPFEAELSVVTTTEGAQEIGKRIGAYVKAHGLEDDPTTAILRRVLKDSLDDIRRNPE